LVRTAPGFGGFAVFPSAHQRHVAAAANGAFRGLGLRVGQPRVIGAEAEVPVAEDDRG
jgi:hypothetical protein